jgi:polysaccharide biosynthesis protein PslL
MFVVLGHNPLTATYPKIFNIIFSFHMPLFFFISGYLFNPDQIFSKYIHKRFNSLIKPYLFTVILISLVYILIKNNKSLLWYLFWTFYGNRPNLPKLVLHLWFLPNLFLVTLFTWLLFRYINILKLSIVIQLPVIAVFLILGFLSVHLFWDLKIPISTTNFFIKNGNYFLINGLLDNPAYSSESMLNSKEFILKGLPWSTDIVLLSTAFFISGYVVKMHRLEKLFHKGAITLILVVVFAHYHYFHNYTIDLNLRRYDNFMICTILAYAGIYVCTYAANIIAGQKNRYISALQYIGRYSLIIFIFHTIMQRIVYQSILALLPNTAYIAILPAFLAGLCLPLLLNCLLLERFKLFRFWYYAR